MKKRYLYTLLFLAPGALVALIVASAIAGTTAGFLWLFVFGDNSWPMIAERGLALLFPFTFFGLWSAFVIAGFVMGKRLEADPVLNKKHILTSIALTLAPLLFILLHQLRVGNIGLEPDSLLCGGYCADKGYSTSGMPPRDSGDRSCICYDDSGNERIKVPMETLRADKMK